ncbi:MAG: glycosyltransferase [Verrucomicrobia bacterium]|nr:glycosyltransferase [Verrucomicrobiota bacterium]
MKKLLFIWNGTVAGTGKTVLGEIGGGDQVIIKCVNLGGLKPDLLLPKSAAGLVPGAGRLYFSAANFNAGLAGLILLLCWRTLQGIGHALRLRGAGYGFIIATSPFFFDLLPLLFAKAKRKGAIIYHVPPPRKAVNLATRIRFTLARLETIFSLQLVRWSCDFLIVGNDHTGQQLEIIAPGKPWAILHAGFDTKKVDRFPDQPKKMKQACFLGRMTSQKGIFDLLDVMERVAKADPEFRLLMMGNGPERAAFVAELEKRRLANVIVKGFVSDEEKYAILKESAFFFFPSLEEGWGIALAEALYCGCKCVTYELPHYRSIFGEFPAYVPLGDRVAFADAVIANLNSPADPAQKNFIAQYDDVQVVRQFAENLEQLK